MVAFGVHQEPQWVGMTELMHAIHRGAVFVDVRSSYLFGSRTIPGSVNIPGPELASRLDELPRDAPVVVFGGIGNDSTSSYQLLRRRGFQVYDLGPYNRLPHAFEHHLHHGAVGDGDDDSHVEHPEHAEHAGPTGGPRTP